MIKAVHFFICIAMALTLTSCGCIGKLCGYRQAERTIPLPMNEEEYVSEATQAVISYAEVLRRARFQLEHSYVMHNPSEQRITGFRLEFSSQDIVEVKKAREDLVDMVEGFLTYINENEDLMGYIENPITANDLEIYINYESYWTLYGDPMYVGWTILQDGIAYYYAGDLKNRHIDWWHSRIEAYFKSFQTVVFSRQAAEQLQMMDEMDKPSKLNDIQYRSEAEEARTNRDHSTDSNYYRPTPR